MLATRSASSVRQKKKLSEQAASTIPAVELPNEPTTVNSAPMPVDSQPPVNNAPASEPVPPTSPIEATTEQSSTSDNDPTGKLPQDVPIHEQPVATDEVASSNSISAVTQAAATLAAAVLTPDNTIPAGVENEVSAVDAAHALPENEIESHQSDKDLQKEVSEIAADASEDVAKPEADANSPAPDSPETHSSTAQEHLGDSVPQMDLTPSSVNNVVEVFSWTFGRYDS